MRLSCLLQHHLYGDNLPGCLVLLHPHNPSTLYTVFLSGIHAHIDMHVYTVVLFLLDWKGAELWFQRIVNCHSKTWLFVFQLEEEFSLMASGLGLLSAPFQPSTSLNGAGCLEWNVNAFELISQWCFELISLVDTPSQQAMVSFRHSLAVYHLWNLVSLAREEILTRMFFFLFFFAVSFGSEPSLVCSSSAAASRKLQHYLPVLSQEGLHCVQ